MRRRRGLRRRNPLRERALPGDKALGESCQDDAECQHGSCVDDVCCNTACTEVCAACDVAGNIGFCTQEPDGSTCATGTCCDGDCINTARDLDNCGECDNVCQAPANAEPTCVNGICGFACAAGFQICEDRCIPDGDDDCCTPDDCPAPDLCQAPAACLANKCVFSTLDDNADCRTNRVCCDGFCCAAGQVCDAQACVFPCGGACGDNQICCAGTCCEPGEACNDDVCSETCDTASQCPPPFDPCQASPACVNGECTFSVFIDGTECADNRICCGGTCCQAGQACDEVCSDTCGNASECPPPFEPCQASAACVNDECTFSVFIDGSDCEPDRVCCDGACCDAGLICDGGTCQAP